MKLHSSHNFFLKLYRKLYEFNFIWKWNSPESRILLKAHTHLLSWDMETWNRLVSTTGNFSWWLDSDHKEMYQRTFLMEEPFFNKQSCFFFPASLITWNFPNVWKQNNFHSLPLERSNHVLILQGEWLELSASSFTAQFRSVTSRKPYAQIIFRIWRDKVYDTPCSQVVSSRTH